MCFCLPYTDTDADGYKLLAAAAAMAAAGAMAAAAASAGKATATASAAAALQALKRHVRGHHCLTSLHCRTLAGLTISGRVTRLAPRRNLLCRGQTERWLCSDRWVAMARLRALMSAAGTNAAAVGDRVREEEADQPQLLRTLHRLSPVYGRHCGPSQLLRMLHWHSPVYGRHCRPGGGRWQQSRCVIPAPAAQHFGRRAVVRSTFKTGSSCLPHVL